MFCRVSGDSIHFDFLPFRCLTGKSRIIALESQGQGPMDLNAFVTSFQKAWTSIINDEPLTCTKTGTQYEPVWGQPCAAIIDVCEQGFRMKLFLIKHVVVCDRSV